MDELDKITSRLKQRLVFPPESADETPRLQTTTTSTGARTTELSSAFTQSTTGDAHQLMTDSLQTDPKEVFTHIQVSIMAYPYCRTRTRISNRVRISIPKMSTVAIRDPRPHRDPNLSPSM